MTLLTSAVPISISEITLYVAVAGMGYFVVKTLLRRSWKDSLGRALTWIAITLAWFYCGWGLNYFRQPIEEQLGFAGSEPVPDSLAYRSHLLWSIHSANSHWREMPPWNPEYLDQEIESAYKNLFRDLNLPLAPGERPPKFLLLPAVFNYTLTSGMFGPFFHEIHLNSELLPVELPFILAHEKAHQMGYAREAEASFLAVLVCLASPDSAIQYSGYFALLGRFTRRASLFSDADSLLKTIRSEVWADFKAVRQRYARYSGAIAEISERSYDLYLRTNRVEGGIKNYEDVVELVIRWRQWQAETAGNEKKIHE